jgi:SAM-dependent methyltransferase
MPYCWICESRIEAFGDYGLPPRWGRCPACGAKPRNRALDWFLRRIVTPSLGLGLETLEIGASRCSLEVTLRYVAASHGRLTVVDVRALAYHAMLRSPHRFVQADAGGMQFRDQSFGLVLCNNVLPWIRDDVPALREIGRCLRAGGLAVLNTCHRAERTMSVTEYRALHPDLDDDYFGENGDQWVYGDDLFERFRAAGLSWRIDHLFADMSPGEVERYGLRPPHEFVLAFRSDHDARRLGERLATAFARYRAGSVRRIGDEFLASPCGPPRAGIGSPSVRVPGSRC